MRRLACTIGLTCILAACDSGSSAKSGDSQTAKGASSTPATEQAVTDAPEAAKAVGDEGSTTGAPEVGGATSDATTGAEAAEDTDGSAEAPALPPSASPTNVEEADPSKYPLRFIPTPTAVIDGAPKTVAWTKVGDLPGAVKVKRLTGGFLAQAKDGSQTWIAGEDGKPTTAEVEVPSTSIFGRYPKDAWYVWLDPHDSAQLTYQLRRWRGNGKWVAQDLGGTKTRDDLDQAVITKGWKAGVLVGAPKDGSLDLWRSAPAGVVNPDPLTVLEGEIGQVFETKSGRLYYTVDVRRDGHPQTLVLRSCEGDGCARETAMAFPTPEGFNANWDLWKTIPRQRHSMSAIANESRRPNAGDGVEGFSWIVHYEAGGWKLERFAPPRRPEYLWPVSDGGLWALVEASGAWELWHRDPEGKWSRVELPPRFDAKDPIQLGMLDETRVWIVGAVEGKWAIWEAPAVEEAPEP